MTHSVYQVIPFSLGPLGAAWLWEHHHGSMEGNRLHQGMEGLLRASPRARREPGEDVWSGSCCSAGAARQKDEEQGSEEQPSCSTPDIPCPHPVYPEGQVTREGQEVLPCTPCWGIQGTIPAGQSPVESPRERSSSAHTVGGYVVSQRYVNNSGGEADLMSSSRFAVK